MPTTLDLVESGQVNAPAALAEVSDLIVRSGARAGQRVLVVRMRGGLEFEVLVSAGFDIGATWWRGEPISWTGPLPASAHDGSAWLSSWEGGLVTTCGTENIGSARGGDPLHGTHHLTAAHDVSWARESRSGEVELTISGTIPSVGPERRVTVHRTITASTGAAELLVHDRVVNDGTRHEPVSMMYHVNFGAPFLCEGTTVSSSAAEITDETGAALGEAMAGFPAPSADSPATLHEHKWLRSGRARCVQVHSPALGGTATLTWSEATLPRLHHWAWLESGIWVLSVEPGTGPLFAADRVSAEADSFMVAPEESLEFAVRIAVASGGPLLITPDDACGIENEAPSGQKQESVSA